MDWTEQELLHEVAVVPARAFVAYPDTRVIEREGWLQLVTPSLRQGGLNGVALCVVDEACIERVIDEVLDEYSRLGLVFRWVVGPTSRPVDLSERLARRGLRGHRLRGLYVEPHRLDAEGSGDDVSVQLVDERGVEAFTQVVAEGWEMAAGPLLDYHRAVLADPADAFPLFLARHRGVPAGAAGLTRFARSGYLVGAVVLPGHRGLGLYRALTRARLAWAQERGLGLVTCWANSVTSAPLLARMGFSTACELESFTNG